MMPPTKPSGDVDGVDGEEPSRAASEASPLFCASAPKSAGERIEFACPGVTNTDKALVVAPTAEAMPLPRSCPTSPSGEKNSPPVGTCATTLLERPDGRPAPPLGALLRKAAGVWPVPRANKGEEANEAGLPTVTAGTRGGVEMGGTGVLGSGVKKLGSALGGGKPLRGNTLTADSGTVMVTGPGEAVGSSSWNTPKDSSLSCGAGARWKATGVEAATSCAGHAAATAHSTRTMRRMAGIMQVGDKACTRNQWREAARMFDRHRHGAVGRCCWQRVVKRGRAVVSKICRTESESGK